jgi:diguanylate cyclase (GGDEF)-like protein
MLKRKSALAAQMFRGRIEPPEFPHRFQVLPETDKRAVKDALILLAVAGTAWVLIERTDTWSRFFDYVAKHPEPEWGPAMLAGILGAIALFVFALRRWGEAAKAECSVRDVAYHDPLTGLPNRRALAEVLAKVTADKSAPAFACLLFDLDNFKQVNDLRGHATGDRLLQMFSQRVAQVLSPDMLFARIGGDEYALLCDLDDRDHAKHIADLVVRQLGTPFLIDGHTIQLAVSVGIACFPQDAEEADALLRKADIALYLCKARGRRQIRFFEAEMERTARRQAEIAEALREGIPRGEIVPHYQPLVDLATRDVIGFEVLARWRSPILGSVAPSEFIPVAMDSGLIGKLCCCLLHRAASEAAGWQQPLPISFNLAPRQLCDPAVPSQILATLSTAGLSPRRFDIEMTEDMFLENDQTALSNLAALKAQGATLTLDDFGTGYSSLHHLRMLPFDRVKIDRSFVSKIVDCSKSRLMVEAMVKLTHSLGIAVLAEGVETEREERLLREMGCDLAQGWLYGKAVPNDALKAYLEHASSMAKPLSRSA